MRKRFIMEVDFWGYEGGSELNQLITKMREYIGGGIYGTGGSFKVVCIGKEIEE